MPEMSCPYNESRLFKNGKCIDDFYIGLFYTFIFLIILWLISQCYIINKYRNEYNNIYNKLGNNINSDKIVNVQSNVVADIESDGVTNEVTDEVTDEVVNEKVKL